MKKKILLTSMVTIVLCLCLIAGSTFALFTSESEMNIAVTSGNVKLTASISAVDLYSVRAAVSGDTDTVLDEYGHEYVYEQQQNGTFANGGTAALNNESNELVLSKITPGDKVVINVASLNTSDVTIKARYTVEVLSGEELARGLVITLKDASGNAIDTLVGLDSYISTWETLAASEQLDATTLEIELPVDAGNEYQHNAILAQNPNYDGVAIQIFVEAVQGNANVQ